MDLIQQSRADALFMDALKQCEKKLILKIEKQSALMDVMGQL